MERAQPEFLCTGVQKHGSKVRVLLHDRSLSLPPEINRDSIVTALRGHGLAAREAFTGELPPMNLEPAVHETWIELLNDLGTYEPDIADISPGLGYERIEVKGTHAWITLAKGEQRLSKDIDLAAKEFPAGLPIDLAFEFNRTCR